MPFATQYYEFLEWASSKVIEKTQKRESPSDAPEPVDGYQLKICSWQSRTANYNILRD